MYQYQDIILPYFPDEHKISEKGELVGHCPFHDDSRPSFSINLESGLYTCHACGESGNIVTFISKKEIYLLKKHIN